MARYLYDPSGNTLSASGPKASVNGYRFSSKPIHDLSGMYDYLYRWYAPELQRWLNRDPLGEYSRLNLYSFADNSPACLIDPMGLLTWGEWGDVIGAGVVGAAQAGLNLLGMANNIGNTAIGLGLGVAGLVAGGGTPNIGNNAIQFPDNPLMNLLPASAITLGNTISYRPTYSPLSEVRTYDGLNTVILGDHERYHTYQEELFGAWFIPSYLLAELFPGDNPFETWADNCALSYEQK